MMVRDFFQMQRFPSHEVKIGNRPMGGNNPIRLQSMTNTDTLNIKATIDQCIKIIEAGADYVRISAPNIKAAEALKTIKDGIRKAGFTHPVIADIHFNAEVALLAARYVEKVRINPGNYTGNTGKGKTEFSPVELNEEKERIFHRLKPLVQTCIDYGTAIRIGTNLGSLSPSIIWRYGNTPAGMVNATFEFLEIFRELSFENLVISLKASKPSVMIEAYEGMVYKMLENNMSYPLHIGITEAGEGENGRIKSALGICNLLNKGIGDTLRVSLTEDPEIEIPFAIKLSSLYQIPFSEQKKPSDYTLQKIQFSEKEIPISEKKYKAIVIVDFNLFQHPSDPGKSLENEFSDDQSNDSKSAQQADYYFTDDEKIATQFPDKQFLIPFEVWQNNPILNSIPLLSYKDSLEFPIPDQSEKFFVSIDCTFDIFELKEIRNHKGLMGIIADMNNCKDEVNLQNWIDFSQQNKMPVIIRKNFSTADSNELISHLSIFAGSYMLEKKIQGLWISAPAVKEDLVALSFSFLQSAGLRITRTEFISCPTCARTSFNLQQVLKNVQQQVSHLPGLKIAVMGCIVNGPGEMADADFGFVGTGAGKLHLYKGKNPVKKNIEPEQATEALMEILKANGYPVE